MPPWKSFALPKLEEDAQALGHKDGLPVSQTEWLMREGVSLKDFGNGLSLDGNLHQHPEGSPMGGAGERSSSIPEKPSFRKNASGLKTPPLRGQRGPPIRPPLGAAPFGGSVRLESMSKKELTLAIGGEVPAGLDLDMLDSRPATPRARSPSRPGTPRQGRSRSRSRTPPRAAPGPITPRGEGGRTPRSGRSRS